MAKALTKSQIAATVAEKVGITKKQAVESLETLVELAYKNAKNSFTGTYDPRWNSDILNPAFSALTANDFEVVQLGYNPPPKPVAGFVQNLHATLVGKTLALSWDKEPSTLTYRVQAAGQIDTAPAWRTVAETSENAWSVSLNTTLGAQFYRVLLIRSNL